MREISRMRFRHSNKPIKEQCPQCGSPYLLEKSTKKEGLVHYCNEETCDYKISVEKEGQKEF
jgi:DNA topoisomerase-1